MYQWNVTPLMATSPIERSFPLNKTIFKGQNILTHQADIDMKYCNNMVSIPFHRSSLNTNCHQVFKLGFVIARLQILNTLVCSF